MIIIIIIIIIITTTIPIQPGKTNLCGRTDDTQGSGVRRHPLKALQNCNNSSS